MRSNTKLTMTKNVKHSATSKGAVSRMPNAIFAPRVEQAAGQEADRGAGVKYSPYLTVVEVRRRSTS
jgi:hypothetical protein